MDRDALSPRTEAIAKKLDDLTPINAAEQPCIFKVHEQLLKVNKEAYKPVLLAIGPYNDHATVVQGIMEKHKLRYLKQMLGRSKEHSLKDYIEALRKLEDRARKCYADAECIIQNTDEFVEMMLLDGCFIIELLHKWEMLLHKWEMSDRLRDEHDPIFRLDWMFAGIIRDLMLFENQLPYFVLEKLFEMSANRAIERQQVGVLEKIFGLTRGVTKDMMKPIPNATEVREAGVKFKAKNRTMFAINFCNGVLEISPLRIDDHTETFLQNLIAHEQCSPYIDSNYVTDYVRIFDDLIDSPKDVKLLRRKGVIENFLGTDEIASAMINKLCSQVMFSTINSIYDKTSIDMNSHCTNSWNVWMAMLWHKYFDSPWALISASAAFLLLVLAITQTIYSI
ncbi:hypothetical protein I3843_01G117200 [Carya illinoinensis]|nr:hypothetical protein I3843_01G117200 [Carya illinoinensis]